MLQPASDTVTDLQEMLQQGGTTPAADTLPVHPRLAPVFPAGLRRGAVYSLLGSVSIAMAMLAGSSQRGSWAGIVGLPDLGVEAAAAWGVDLDHLVLIPSTRPDQWVTAVAALAEIADLVIACPPPRITAGDVQRLTARLRQRRSSLIVVGAWERPTATVQVTTIGWDGLDQGHGCLIRQHLEIEVVEKHRRRSTRLTIEGSP